MVVQLSLAGSYSSALVGVARLPYPPATSTLPEGNSVAVWKKRPLFKLPVVVVQLSLAGSYSSALVRVAPLPYPPATSTLPEGNSEAVC